MSLVEKIERAAETLRKEGMVPAENAVILGTGLGGLIDEIDVVKTIEYSSIPGFQVPTVETHDGRLVYGKLSGKNILALDGRLHYYEGYSMEDITFPVYVMKAIGVKRLFISNAAGNLHPEWNKGEIMLLDDHINLLPDNPLRGPNDSKLGPRWPDMIKPYDGGLNELVRKVAGEMNLTLRKGVYIAVQGPNLETRAEYRMLRNMGADAVGMSTVPEVIVANYLNLPVCALSVLTDDCDPERLAPIDIKEIMKIASSAEMNMTGLLTKAFKLLD